MARPIPKSEASVIDIFDYSRDDPFERVQMNAIDDMAELRDVLEKSQTPPSENKGSFFATSLSHTLKSAQQDVALSGQNGLLGRAFIMKVSLLGQK